MKDPNYDYILFRCENRLEDSVNATFQFKSSLLMLICNIDSFYYGIY